MNDNEKKAFSLGWCVAHVHKNKHTPRLTIISPSHAGENTYAPAESVSVYGRDSLQKLRDCLDELLQEEKAREVT